MPDAKDWAATRARAQAIAEKLEKATTSFNASIQTAEDAIKSLRLGVPGVARLDSWVDHEDGVTHFRALRYMKLDNQWRLAIEFATDLDEDDGKFEPLLNASRELRLLAMGVLPELVENMIKAAETELGEVSSAAQKAQSFVASLGVGSGKGK